MNYHIEVDGKKRGPFTAEQLWEAVDDGALSEDAVVVNDSGEDVLVRSIICATQLPGRKFAARVEEPQAQVMPKVASQMSEGTRMVSTPNRALLSISDQDLRRLIVHYLFAFAVFFVAGVLLRGPSNFFVMLEFEDNEEVQAVLIESHWSGFGGTTEYPLRLVDAQWERLIDGKWEDFAWNKAGHAVSYGNYANGSD